MKFSVAAAVLGLAQQRVSATPVDGAETAHCVCCSTLAKELPGKVIAPDDSFYEARLSSYYSANAAQAPWCMVLPESTDDVSKIANIFTQNSCPFGMRGGAHSAFKGSNGIKDGVTVDFGYMNTTVYDETNKIAKIQPGSDWERVFDTLDPYGVTAVGGRASVVGVGGFTTGGGYSFHTGSHGFACDNVANFEVVLADGSVVNANADENADLWKALKGGSGNLGFVTRIDQNIVESTSLWGGFTDYDFENRDKVFNAYLNFADNMGEDQASQNIVAMYYDNTGFSLRSILTNSEGKAAPPAFDEYLTIANTSSTARVGTVAEMVPEFTGPTPLGLYANWFVGMTTNDFQVLDSIEKLLRQYAATMTAAAPDSEFNVLVQFQPVTQSIVDHSIAKGGNILNLEAIVADGPVIMWLVALTVDTAENQEILLPLGQQLVKDINDDADAQGTNKNWNYLNYAWADEDPIASYGAESVEFLKTVAGQYDPTGVFQHLRQTGFKIPA